MESLCTSPLEPRTPAVHLLVVDDHADTARAMSRLLRKEGYVVSIAEDADTAVRLALAEPIDLLICDIGLPGCNGWDLLHRIVQERPIVGIAVSGYGTNSDVQRSREAGYAAHLTKPIDFQTLNQTILREMRITVSPNDY